MTEVAYGRYEDAYKAIHSALNNLACPPSGTKITKHEFTWNSDGSLATLKAFDDADLLFTLTYTWNSDGTLQKIVRS